MRSLTFIAIVWYGLFSGNLCSAQTFVGYDVPTRNPWRDSQYVRLFHGQRCMGRGPSRGFEIHPAMAVGGSISRHRDRSIETGTLARQRYYWDLYGSPDNLFHQRVRWGRLFLQVYERSSRSAPHECWHPQSALSWHRSPRPGFLGSGTHGFCHVDEGSAVVSRYLQVLLNKIRRRATTAPSSVVSPVLPLVRSARACFTHCARADGVRSSSRATAPTVLPSSKTSRTAPILNSSLNCRRARLPPFVDPILDIVSTFRTMSTKPDQTHVSA